MKKVVLDETESGVKLPDPFQSFLKARGIRIQGNVVPSCMDICHISCHWDGIWAKHTTTLRCRKVDQLTQQLNWLLESLECNSRFGTADLLFHRAHV